MTKPWIGLGLGLALLADALPARAGFTYVFDQGVYTADPGGTVDVGVLLREVVDPGGTSVLGAEGLIGAGARVAFDVPPVPGDPARVLGLADIAPNPGFDDPFGPTRELDPGRSAGFSAVVDVGSPAVVGVEVEPGVFELRLGTFRFTAGTTSGEVTTIRAVDFSALIETVSGGGTGLDGQILGAEALVAVAGSPAVPEPSSLLLGTIGLVCGIGVVSRRARSIAKATPDPESSQS